MAGRPVSAVRRVRLADTVHVLPPPGSSMGTPPLGVRVAIGGLPSSCGFATRYAGRTGPPSPGLEGGESEPDALAVAATKRHEETAWVGAPGAQRLWMKRSGSAEPGAGRSHRRCEHHPPYRDRHPVQLAGCDRVPRCGRPGWPDAKDLLHAPSVSGMARRSSIVGARSPRTSSTSPHRGERLRPGRVQHQPGAPPEVVSKPAAIRLRT